MGWDLGAWAHITCQTSPACWYWWRWWPDSEAKHVLGFKNTSVASDISSPAATWETSGNMFHVLEIPGGKLIFTWWSRWNHHPALKYILKRALKHLQMTGRETPTISKLLQVWLKLRVWELGGHLCNTQFKPLTMKSNLQCIFTARAGHLFLHGWNQVTQLSQILTQDNLRKHVLMSSLDRYTKSRFAQLCYLVGVSIDIVNWYDCKEIVTIEFQQ